MVLVLSANSNRSRQVIREVERAVAGDVAILPFRIDLADPTGALAYFLGTEHWLDAITPPMERHIERLSRTVRFLISSEPVPREDLDRPPASLGRSRRRPGRAAVAAVAAGSATVLDRNILALGFATGGRSRPVRHRPPAGRRAPPTRRRPPAPRPRLAWRKLAGIARWTLTPRT